MAIIEANLNEVEAWGGESVQLPPGEYQFKVKNADVESKADGEKTKLQLVVDYEVLSGTFAGKTAKAWFQLDFSKDAPRKRLKSLILACNVPLSPNGSFDTAQLVGCKLNADVTHESYESKPDPITGAKVEKTAVRIVNERPFRDVVEVASSSSPVQSNGPVAGRPVPSVGGSLPGLTKA